MDLRYTDEEIAFRDEVRAFFAQALPPDIRRKCELGQRVSKPEMLRWVRILHKQGWATPSWAPEWGGTGWSAVQQYIFKEELRSGAGPRADLVQHEHDRPDPDRLRHRRTEAPLPAAHRAHGLLVLPGLLGAGRRLGPGRPAHQRRPRRRPLRRQRPEALDLHRPPRRLVLPARAHRPGSQEAARHHLPADGHEVARRHGPADHHHRRPSRNERNVPRRRAHARGQPRRRREQGLGLRQVPARPRAQRHRARGRVQVPRAPRQAARRAACSAAAAR